MRLAAPRLLRSLRALLEGTRASQRAQRSLLLLVLAAALVATGCLPEASAHRRRHRGGPTTTVVETSTTTSGHDHGDPTTTQPGGDPTSTTQPGGDPSTTLPGGEETTTTQPPPLEVLARSCEESDLPLHDGSQTGERCVATDMGEVPSEENAAAVVITDFPETVQAGQEFNVTIASDNLIRDRFLPAAQNGYYLEMGLLDPETGITRGHLHTWVQPLNEDGTPAPASNLEFFVATEDGGGGTEPDQITLTVSPLTPGPKRLCVVAGSGSHAPPLIPRARMAVAVDCVRITVTE